MSGLQTKETEQKYKNFKGNLAIETCLRLLRWVWSAAMVLRRSRCFIFSRIKQATDVPDPEDASIVAKPELGVYNISRQAGRSPGSL